MSPSNGQYSLYTMTVKCVCMYVYTYITTVIVYVLLFYHLCCIAVQILSIWWRHSDLRTYIYIYIYLWRTIQRPTLPCWSVESDIKIISSLTCYIHHFSITQLVLLFIFWFFFHVNTGYIIFNLLLIFNYYKLLFSIIKWNLERVAIKTRNNLFCYTYALFMNLSLIIWWFLGQC